MDATTGWFLAIAALWTGYFFLEGFDFGAGALAPLLGRNDAERRVVINTIGPVWDGNEVWLLAAIGGTLAAFPEWYASLLSAFYLPVLLIVGALIVRVLAFEYRGKRSSERWRRGWDRTLFFGSVVPAFGWGLVLANQVRGIALDPGHEYAGSPLDLLNPYALLGGVATLLLFLVHGAVFLTLKTRGRVRSRARISACRTGLVAVVAVAGFLVWTQFQRGTVATWLLGAVTVAALVLAVQSNRYGRDGWAFTATGTAVAGLVATLFVALYPAAIPSTLGSAQDLTIAEAAASPYALTVLTWSAALLAPFVVLYQAWTYWVFRHRIDVRDLPA
jgi:cytochrome bd ubiquinol oxidase subunit II